MLKSKILTILENHRGVAISGEKLAQALSVTRAAIWKAISALKKVGYKIKARPHHGYQLADNSDILSAEGIRLSLLEKYRDFALEVFPVIDSTIIYAKKIIADGAGDKTIIIADEQTAGRGRLGRSFFSPPQTGIYFSMIFRPQKTLREMQFTTIMMAVAICQAIEKLALGTPQIKWVNDILINGKKVGGILTEAISDYESGMVESLIVSAGVNVKTRVFSADLRNIATSLLTSTAKNNLTRNVIIAEIINHFLALFNQGGCANLIAEYKNRSAVLNQMITYQQNNKTLTARAIDINELGNLIVKNRNGKINVLHSGEISVKLR